MSPEDLLADLPPLRDDEPSSLRQEIADELADHLECAVRREQVKSNGADDVERRVLERFGNPRQIARRLWWLAMWSRIMSQRVLLGVSLTGNVLAILLSVAVFWQFGREREVLSRERAALALQLDEQRTEWTSRLEVVTAALEKLKRQPETIVPAGDPVLKVRLEGPDAGTPPPIASAISYRGTDTINNYIKDVQSFSRQSNLLNLRTVPAGEYRINVSVGSYQLEKSYQRRPGDQDEIVLRCPGTGDGPLVELQFRVDLPADFRARGFAALAEFQPQPITIGGNVWTAKSFFGCSDNRFQLATGVASLLDEPASRDQFVHRLGQHLTGPLPFTCRLPQGTVLSLTRLTFVDAILEAQARLKAADFSQKAQLLYGVQLRSVPIFDFSAEQLREFAELTKPQRLNSSPLQLTLPESLVTRIREQLVWHDAADADRPVNVRPGPPLNSTPPATIRLQGSL